MSCIIILNQLNQNIDFSGADLIFPNLSNFLNILFEEVFNVSPLSQKSFFLFDIFNRGGTVCLCTMNFAVKNGQR